MQDSGRGFVQALPRAHQIEIVIGMDAKRIQGLVEQPAMLRGDSHSRKEGRLVFPELRNDGRELDRFGPRAEHEEDFFQVSLLVPVGDASFGQVVW